MATNYNPRIVTDGLVLCLDAGNTKSYPGPLPVAGWYDLSGNGNNGSLVNGVGYDGGSGGSLVFDGSNQTISVIKPNPNISGYITMNVWVKFNNLTDTVIIHKGSHYSFKIRLISGTYYWAYADSSNYSYSSFSYRAVSGLYQVNTWMNLTVVKETNNDVKLYKNGLLLDTRTSFGSALTATDTTLWLSGYSDTDNLPGTNLLNGNIAQVSIYNRALTAAEVQQNFNATRSRYGI